MDISSTHRDTYWATETDPEALVSLLTEKVSAFDRHLDMTGRWLTARDLYYNYYLVNEQNYLYPNYNADGFKRLNVNHFRAILKHLLSLVTAQRVSPEPIATNSDYKSQAQVDFCKNVLRYVEKEKRLDNLFEHSVETALVLGGAYVSREWDAALGDPYGVDANGGVKRKGDFVVSVYNWLDVIFDASLSSYEASKWKILRRYENRWDIMAKFPLKAEEIKNSNISPITKRHRLGHVINEPNDDIITVYTFYHEKTPALPNGRCVMFLGDDGQGTVLFDGALPYKRVPVERIVADAQINSPFPYSVSMDLLPIQKVYNALCSIICTNQAAFGVQNVLVPRECSIALTQLTEGLNAIYYDPMISQGAKPEALNLLSTKEEVFKWIEYLEKLMAKISGVNETIQGNPSPNLKSGTALAFVASQAMVFINPLSRSYTGLLEGTWTGVVDILKVYATTPRLLLISGLNHKADATEFSSKDIADIDRVIVEAGNPLMDTLAGRLQVGQDLVQQGLLNKEEYLTVLRTGQLEPIYAYERAELMTIKRENEQLQKGNAAVTIVTDNHPLHIREHLTVLSDPAVRENANSPVVRNTLQHIQEHMDLWKQATANNPAILAVQNIPPFPLPPAPPAPAAKVSESINYKDLPPPAQEALLQKAGLAPNGQPIADSPSAPQGQEKPKGDPFHANPHGTKAPGAGPIANLRPGEVPSVEAPDAPKMPAGAPAINQEAANRTSVPPVPMIPQK
jgi:hypothetical protein